jgi:hypothetical protein
MPPRIDGGYTPTRTEPLPPVVNNGQPAPTTPAPTTSPSTVTQYAYNGALTRPQRSDFQGLPPRLRDTEYRDALSNYNAVVAQQKDQRSTQQANTIMAGNGGRDHLNADAAGKQLAQLAATDPAVAGLTGQKMLTSLKGTDKEDNVAQAFVETLTNDQLKDLAKTPEGAAFLKSAKDHLLSGSVHDRERNAADRIDTATSAAESGDAEGGSETGGVEVKTKVGDGSVKDLADKVTGAPEDKPQAGTTTKDKTTGSVTVGPDGVGVDANSKTTRKTVNPDGSSNSSSTSGSGGIFFNPSDNSVTVSGEKSFGKEIKNSSGYGLSFEAGGKASVTAGVNSKDGYTTYSASSDVSVSAKGGIETPKIGAEYGKTYGVKASYEVKMPQTAAMTTDLTSVNPFNPASMPTGTTVTMDGSKYTGTELKASFRELAIETKITDEKGVSYSVTKTGDNTVTVTAGPTEAIKAYNAVGVDIEVAKVMLGRNDKLSGATLKTAQFDLSTAQGQAAYKNFVANGKVPSNNGAGVSNVETIQKLDYTSQAKIEAGIGPFEASFDGAKNSLSQVVTTLPDGTSTSIARLQYSGNVPWTITRKFDAAGNEVLAERRYTALIDTKDYAGQLLSDSISNGQAAQKGSQAEVTFTQDQMTALMKQTQTASSENSNLRILVAEYDGKFTNSTDDFAMSLMRNLNMNYYGLSQDLFLISQKSGPISASVRRAG